VTVDAGQPSGDALRSLREWLSDADELRGRVRLRPGDPPTGTLGSLSDALVIAAPVAGALVPALVSWIRSRHTDVNVKIDRRDGVSIEVSAHRLRRLGADALAAEIERLVRAVEPSTSTGSQPGGPAPTTAAADATDG